MTLLVFATVTALLVRSLAYAWAMVGTPRPSPARDAPSPTVIIPAYNEALVLEAAVDAALAAQPAAVLIVDDRSTDETAAVAGRLARRHANVETIGAGRNLGKAGALNLGVEWAETEWVVCIDADTLVAPDALTRLMAVASTPGVVAVGGRIEVGNPWGPLGRAQHIEYALECERRWLQIRLGALTTVPGALGAFHRPTLRGLGGYPTGTLVEDTDLTLRLLAAGGRVAYAPGARARTEVPTTLRGWWRQRDRWSAGLLAALRRERRSGPRVRLLVDELLAPLVAPWACALALGQMSGPSLVLLSALGLSVFAETCAALRGARPCTAAAALSVVVHRVGYAVLTSVHLTTLLVSLAAGRHVPWRHPKRVGLEPPACRSE